MSDEQNNGCDCEHDDDCDCEAGDERRGEVEYTTEPTQPATPPFDAKAELTKIAYAIGFGSGEGLAIRRAIADIQQIQGMVSPVRSDAVFDAKAAWCIFEMAAAYLPRHNGRQQDFQMVAKATLDEVARQATVIKQLNVERDELRRYRQQIESLSNRAEPTGTKHVCGWVGLSLELEAECAEWRRKCEAAGSTPKGEAENVPHSEHGPIYGVELLDTLPLDSGMRQALPSRCDLDNVRRSHFAGSDRTVAGYEVLLEHYRRSQAARAAEQGKEK